MVEGNRHRFNFRPQISFEGTNCSDLPLPVCLIVCQDVWFQIMNLYTDLPQILIVELVKNIKFSTLVDF